MTHCLVADVSIEPGSLAFPQSFSRNMGRISSESPSTALFALWERESPAFVP